MRRKIRVRDLKNVVLRIRVSTRIRESLEEVARRKTSGKVSPLVRYYIRQGLKRDK